ncbi:rRNA maturation RNase YbeY [Candidatus Woesebacteria bacterium RIFCSPHIGHO2_12_FULL_42_9]|uniref:rRNA maturation RNase YbeY n=3 Tax=Candidatus Woeseibacteriota TaxID=1752722 RepID=A0A1F8APT1_9BACT|nr:MAG: rRNA maturation RNase YbeY [Candidatus Woesebacteria bacterium GWA1_42_12]OGM06341.1 MAG: rRNA maturation RNase YbeY [Candidatus Woesebacteria bacterium GWC1_42_13]OGM53764.1 MAG: rRNA maturation RNase YbeY [Candidatus Woesebacteria bacterium RIFCSPHIGHO2_12_FULL_42_9]
MIKVSVIKQSNYPVASPYLKKKLSVFFKKQGITSDAEVSVAIVGEAKMLSATKAYLKDGKLHNVLSFTPEEVKDKFVYPPDGVIRLGEIIVCYPVALSEARKEGKLINDKVYELLEHGAMHLLGLHHE